MARPSYSGESVLGEYLHLLERLLNLPLTNTHVSNISTELAR